MALDCAWRRSRWCFGAALEDWLVELYSTFGEASSTSYFTFSERRGEFWCICWLLFALRIHKTHILIFEGVLDNVVEYELISTSFESW